MKNLPYTLRIGVIGQRNLKTSDQLAGAAERVSHRIQQVFDGASAEPWGAHGSPETWSLWWDRQISRFGIGPVMGWCGMPLPAVPASIPLDRRTELAWTVLSTFASPSDRIVARAILAQQPAARFQAVLPLPMQEFLSDLESPEDRADAAELIARDREPTVLASPHSESATCESARGQAYELAGRRVVETCEVLIVIWDGQQGGGSSETADTVRYALERGRRVVWIDARNPDAEPHWLVRDATKNAGPQPDMFIESLPQRARDWSLGFHRLAAFQRASLMDPKRLDQLVQAEAKAFKDAAEQVGIGGKPIEPMLEHLLPHYVRADQLAVDYQKRYTFAAQALFRLSALAVTVAVAQLLFFPHLLPLVLLEIGAMLAALLLLRGSRREAWHEKWLNDRHLAEWLRTSMFTTLVGTCHAESSQEGGGRLPFYHGAEYWFIDTYQSQQAKAIRDSSRLPLESLKRFLIDHWIRDQAEYHRRNAKKKHRIAHAFHRRGLWLFTATLVMASLHGLGVGHVSHHEASSELHAPPGLAIQAWELLGKLITFLAIVLPAWGASAHGVATLLDYDRIAARSHQMANFLESLAGQAEETRSYDELRRVVAQTEELMATENQEWLASLSFHGLVLPA